VIKPRFFDTVKAIERQIELRKGQNEPADKAFLAVRSQFAMLKAQVAYAKGRLKGKMPDAFVQFIVDHVHSVGGSVETFKDFVRHFEAVVAFHKYYGKEERN
jgi:CRISPR-associated protein Csm2